LLHQLRHHQLRLMFLKQVQILDHLRDRLRQRMKYLGLILCLVLLHLLLLMQGSMHLLQQQLLHHHLLHDILLFLD
jgi:hypothetical protein